MEIFIEKGDVELIATSDENHPVRVGVLRLIGDGTLQYVAFYSQGHVRKLEEEIARLKEIVDYKVRYALYLEGMLKEKDNTHPGTTQVAVYYVDE